MMLEAVAVDERREVPSTKKLVDTRKALLTHIKKVTSRGKAELIVKMERDIIENDLDRYAKADDKDMIGSLKAGLLGVAAIERQLEIVDDPGKYEAVDRAHGLPKNRKQSLPLDEARQAFGSHRARLGNYLKYRLEDTEKQVIQARIKALSVVEKDYIARQAETLGVKPPASAKRAKPPQTKEARRTKKRQGGAVCRGRSEKEGPGKGLQVTSQRRGYEGAS